MTAKEFLSQAYRLDRKADMMFRKADAMRKSLYGRGNSGENHGGGDASDSIGRAIARVIAYEEQADRIIEELVRKRLLIENAIAAVPDEVQREILERRYLLYQPFVSGYNKKTGEYIRGIAEDMNYSERQVYRLHGMALLKINVSECQ